MSSTVGTKTFQDIQQEYNRLFKEENVRDEDRAYRWHAENVTRLHPGAQAALDVACGGGYFLRELRRLHPKLNLVGCDISTQALTLAKEQCPDANLLVNVAEAMPFQNATFDLITCLGSLEHFLDIPGAIREMIRISKPGAYFYIMVPNLFWYKDLWAVLRTGWRKDRNQTQERFSTLGEWQDTLEQSGLKVLEVKKYNGIARRPAKQWIKDIVIPLKFSYHFIFICQAANHG